MRRSTVVMTAALVLMAGIVSTLCMYAFDLISMLGG